MRVIFIVMHERRCKVLQGCSHIQFRHERDIVFLHRLHEPFSHYHCSAGCSPLLYMAPDSALRRTSAFHARYIFLNRCPSATALVFPAACRQSAFPPTSASHPARSNCHNLRACCPVYGLTVAAVQRERYPQFSPLSQPNSKPSEHQRISLSATAIFPYVFTLRSLWFVMQQQQVMLAHYPVKPFGIHRWLSLCATLLAQDAPRVDNHNSAYR